MVQIMVEAATFYLKHGLLLPSLLSQVPRERDCQPRLAVRFFAGSAWGVITGGEPCADAEDGQGGRGETGIGARGVPYMYVKSNVRQCLDGQ
jgi:hypothetical protein